MAVILRPGDSNDLVRLLQARLNRDYPLYSNLVVDGIYGPRTTAVVREFQRRAGLQVDGIAGPKTLGRLGLNFDQPPPLPTYRPFFYCASGTWATPFQGPPFDVGWRVEQMGLVRNQPVGYPAAGYLTGWLRTQAHLFDSPADIERGPGTVWPRYRRRSRRTAGSSRTRSLLSPGLNTTAMETNAPPNHVQL